MTVSFEFVKRYLFGIGVILLPWVFIVLLRQFGPIQFPALDGSLVIFIISYLFSCAFLFSIGYMTLKSIKNGVRRNWFSEIRSSEVSRLLYFVVLICAIIYPVLAFYDFWVLKTGSLHRIVEMRELANQVGPRDSMIGAFVALFSASPPIIFVMEKIKSEKNSARSWFVSITTILGFIAMFLSGGRNPFFIGLFFILIFLVLFLREPLDKLPNRNGSLKKVLLSLLILFGLIGSMYIFIARFGARGVAVNDIVSNFSYAYNLPIWIVDTKNVFINALHAIFVLLTFYVTHSLNYINEYFVAGYSPGLNGAYSVPQLARLVDVAFGTSFFVDAQSSLLVVGAYISLPGSLYLDFGYVGGILVGSLFCYLFGYLLRNKGGLACYQKIVLPYVVVLLLFSPVYCVLGTANGFSMLFFSILLMLLSIRFSGRRSYLRPHVTS